MLSHLFSQNTHANAGKVVDGESDVAGVLAGEDAFEAGAESFVSHACSQLDHADFLRDVLKQDLDEDTAAGRGFILVQVDDGEAVPAEGVGGKHVAEQHGNVS